MSGCPSTRASSRTVTATTSPSTMVDSPRSTVECSRHSRDAGEPATRGGATSAEGSSARPTAAASSTPGANRALVALTWSISGRLATLTTNSPVASTFRNVSLVPTEVNCTIGGRAEATVKKEWGARLCAPSADSVDTHAIGRGTTSAVSRR